MMMINSKQLASFFFHKIYKRNLTRSQNSCLATNLTKRKKKEKRIEEKETTDP